jgi:MFS transporter, DHA2 family, lincomycin resistance protein
LRAGVLVRGGASPIEAQLGGFHLAFLVAAVAAAGAFVMSMFVTKAVPASPELQPHAEATREPVPVPEG